MGSSRTFTEPSSLICEFDRVGSLLGATSLIEDVVVLSQSRALVLPKATSAMWEVFLTAQFQQKADQGITKLRWRPSRHGGRTWAKPLALDSQIAAKRARDRDSVRPDSQTPDPSGLIIIRGSLGAKPEELMEALLAAIGRSLNISLARGRPLLSLQTHEWAETRKGDGSWSGQVRIQLATWQELQALKTLLDSSVIELDGEHRAVEVHSPYLLENGTVVGHTPNRGNVRGGRVGRPSPQ